MKWINNGDPPLYVWEGDVWYNQKDKSYYYANIERRSWDFMDQEKCVMDVDLYVEFPKKTRVMTKGK